MATVVPLTQTVNELGTENVNLAVEDPSLIGNLKLFFCEIADQVLELDVRQRAKSWEGVQRAIWLLSLPSGAASIYRASNMHGPAEYIAR